MEKDAEGSCRDIFQGINPAFWTDRDQPIKLQILSGKTLKLYS
jgi:hypothetical protein